jgi:hypothetical protein
MSNYSDWELRRAEIGAQIQNYEIGVKPPRPDSITASYSGGTLTVKITVNSKTLTLTSQVILPSGIGPFPAVIGMNSPSGSIPASIFTSRNVAQITFSHNQVTTYGSPSTSNPYYQLYPNLNPTNTGQYSAWAWGVSRIIDGLELVQNVLPIDLNHLAATGCSYAGKMALFCGAFDERIALTIAQESGGGGATSWRYSNFINSKVPGSVEDIDNTDYNWFMNSMSQFSGDNVSKLPEDHHELMAMCAPRALFITANPPYVWLAGESSYVVSEACQTIYNTLGVTDRFGFSIVGGHNHCAVPDSQIPELGAFVDKFLLGKDTANTNIHDTYNYNSDLASWITWTNPILTAGTTYFTSLAYPANLQVGLDTNITFKWSKIVAAQKYLIQVSTDPAFKSNIISDSTTTDTLKIFTSLLKNQKYYWRVKVKSASSIGPWSTTSSFITTLSLPPRPQINSASSNTMGYVTFQWNKVANASQYSIQVAYDSAFVSIFKSATASDTVSSLSWFSEIKYYWRVQASNLAGSGLWSDAGNFTLVYAPSNLALQISGSNLISLTWTNNSSIEDGNVIERKQNSQTSYSVIDTLKGSGNQYVDSNAVEGQTYVYRVKAYNNSFVSSYSNEASSNVTGVNKVEEIPTEYSISQNYPNPFNPTTKIKFALPQRALTKIIIYDLLGREVQTLLNKELEAGYREISFDASNFQSGVYFYRIQSGNFIQTKKMILIK